MKKLNIIIFLMMFAVLANAQEVNKKEVAEFKVEGSCDQCKKRIETALDIKGVKFAEWNKTTKMLKVVFSPEKIELDEIHRKIAEVGHNTDKINAQGEVYNKLPECCKYKTKSTH